KFPRILAIVLSILLFIVVIAVLIWLVTIQVGSFAEELPRIIQKAEVLLEQTTAMVERYFNVSRSEQVSRARGYLINALAESRTMLLNTLVATTGTLATATLVPLYVFFFLLYRDFFRRFVYKAFNKVPRHKLDTVLNKIYDVIQSYLAGLVLVIFIVGILNTIGLLILGIDYAIFFGFLAAFLILIPYVGILIGSLFPALMSIITEDSAWYAVGVVGVMSFVQFLEGNFITPNIVGSKVSINPLAAIVMLLLGGQLWGLPGLVLALPLTAILKVILDANKSTEPFGFLLGEPGKEVEEEKEKERDQVRNVRENRRRPGNQQRSKRKPRTQPKKEEQEFEVLAVKEPLSIAKEALEGNDLVIKTAETKPDSLKRRRPQRRRKPRTNNEGSSETPKSSGDQDS
ncbi:AI-2E family transporter, partial [Persicitalea sp.]|uniref:AI-2E family transporter n=1 Tax=Persicitalea sp. TaxID=3100273 RepID=UPI00359484B6